MDDSGRSASSGMFDSAEWYDAGVNWDARLEREIPVLCDVMGPPGDLGLLDAGCGTGRQAVAMVRAGYRVTGQDASDEMLRVASEHAAAAGVHVPWVGCRFESLHDSVTHFFDGVYCIGNSLAAAGSADAIGEAVRNFAAVLRPGGRLLVQVVNFTRMRQESPCVRGPRVSRVGGTEYISFRVFRFEPEPAEVVNITAWNDGQWRQRSHTGRLYPLEFDEFERVLADAGMRVDAWYGDYQRSPFDRARSDDLIAVATRA
ncbi:MAG: class I SAM-dependent methyltransferase [Phycisphaerales bacterium]|nr:MAG: class I SAM-dependent methyltransferase [Phycisphaerales bacterium]